MKKAYCIFGICALLAAAAAAQNLGGRPGAYLRAPVGADALARGGAATANPRHLFSWYNPALLVRDKDKKLTLGGSYRSLGRTEGVGAWEFRVPPRVGMGMSALYRGDPFLNRLYDNEGNKLERGSYTTLTFKVGLAYLVHRAFFCGANVSAFYQRLPVGYTDADLSYESAIDMGGFDIAMHFAPRDNTTFGLIVKNLGAGITIKTGSDYAGYEQEIETKFLPTIVLGSEIAAALRGKPFIWSCDIKGYAFDGGFSILDHPLIVLNNGFEWQNWETFHIRAGIRDIKFSGDMVNNSGRYRDHFSFAVTAGFKLDLSEMLKGLALNYAFSTDKVWAGVENTLDFIYVF
jgi:hypothetical protein